MSVTSPTTGNVYTEQIAKVRKVRLGWEDHGIFTLMADLDYGTGGQGAGGYALDEPRRDGEDDFIGRFGTAFGMEWVIRFMRACGVDDFAKCEGRTVLALREEGYHGKVVGLAPLPTERGDIFIFEELTFEFADPDDD